MMNKGLWIALVLSLTAISGFFCFYLTETPAEETKSSGYQKYYTCICLEEGDTLWSIADQYNVHSNKSMEEYVCELRHMNRLLDDTIHAGHYLTISYYLEEEPDAYFQGGK